MGMTIDEIIGGLKETVAICDSVYAYDRQKYIDGAIDRLCKYQMMQADYEARLSADMVAMLEEILLEIEEMDSGCGWEGYRPTAQVIGLIQQKINSLQEART